MTARGPGPVPHENPWRLESLESRLAWLAAAPARVAWLYEEPDFSTFRYRVFNMIECLRGQADGRVAAAWFRRAEIPFLLPRVAGLRALVVARCRYGAELAGLIAAARAKGVPVLFDCDDLIFDTRHTHLVMQTLGQSAGTDHAMDFWFAQIARLEAAARLCDGGITTNETLAGHMRKVVPGPVAVVPNFLNRRQQEISGLLLRARRESGWRGDGITRIGYFSGTPSHNNDFAVAAPALARLLERDPGVRLWIVGWLDVLGPLEALRGRIDFFPLQDFINLQRLIAAVDINIAPLQNNFFTHCKSELKYFEAAAVGTWTLASRTPNFERAVPTPRRGVLVDPPDWDAALAGAVELVRNPAVHAPMAAANAEEVAEIYGWDKFSGAIESAVFRNGI